MSAIAGGMTLRKTATQDSSAEHADTDGADSAGGTRSGGGGGGGGGGSDASDPAKPPFDKRPPAGMDMLAEMAWRKKQKAAKAEAAASDDAGKSGTLFRCPASRIASDCVRGFSASNFALVTDMFRTGAVLCREWCGSG